MSDETEVKPKRTRTVTPRSETHQAVLDAVHAWCKCPMVPQREAMLKAMLEHKRFMNGDANITAL